jgi:hypothetical protein
MSVITSLLSFIDPRNVANEGFMSDDDVFSDNDVFSDDGVICGVFSDDDFLDANGNYVHRSTSQEDEDEGSGSEDIEVSAEYDEEMYKADNHTEPTMEFHTESNGSLTDKQLPVEPSQTAAHSSLAREADIPNDTPCFRWCGHGAMWTSIAILFACGGCALSILTRQSLQFVHLQRPLIVASIFDPVSEIGLIRMEICYNNTLLPANGGCRIISLEGQYDQDMFFSMTRLLVSSASMFGCFFTLCLSSAIFWESINLRPIGLGFIITYFLQSFTMLVFETRLCKEQICGIGMGFIQCILASACWLAACIAVAKMDAFKIQANRSRRRQVRRRARKEKKSANIIATTKEYARQTTSNTHKTLATSGSLSSRSDEDAVMYINEAEIGRIYEVQDSSTNSV